MNPKEPEPANFRQSAEINFHQFSDLGWMQSERGERHPPRYTYSNEMYMGFPIK